MAIPDRSSLSRYKVEAADSFAVENILCVRVAATDGRNPQPSPLSCQLFVLFPLISNNLWDGSKRYRIWVMLLDCRIACKTERAESVSELCKEIILLDATN